VGVSAFPQTERVSAGAIKTFGTAISSAPLTWNEQNLFNYTASNPAAITHWWFTGGPDVDNVILRFYIDGESTASIQLSIDMAVGIGFDDDTAPWGNALIGKGARTGGVYNNIRIPFQRQIRITCQQPTYEPQGGFYFIVRGAENIPIYIGDLVVPSTARLQVLKIVNVTYNPLDLVNVVTYAGGPGALLMWTLSVASGNLNFLEGCVRAYIDGGAKMLLSSGTEDYFDSAYYFDGGRFTFQVSGLTHDASANGPFGTTLSAYRFHTQDPIVWQNTFQLVWRNGDTVNPQNGQKCIDDNGNTVGNPTKSIVNTYAWVYTW